MKILWSEIWKRRFQLMQILGLLGMHFDAEVVFVTSHSLLFRLAVAILYICICNFKKNGEKFRQNELMCRCAFDHKSISIEWIKEQDPGLSTHCVIHTKVISLFCWQVKYRVLFLRNYFQSYRLFPHDFKVKIITYAGLQSYNHPENHAE